MARILLTASNLFTNLHLLKCLLARGHSVVNVVRSQQGLKDIKSVHPNVSKDKLDFAIVKYPHSPDSFNEAVVSDPPFEAVIHTAKSNYKIFQNATRTQNEILAPVLIDSTSILNAIKMNAPTVKRVVTTSSLGAVLDPMKIADKTYSEVDWFPVTEAPTDNFRARQTTLGERAAWDFVEKEKPNFTLTSCLTPEIFGPIIPVNGKHSSTIKPSIIGSNLLAYKLMTGAAQRACPSLGQYLFADVRDVALGYVLAAEKEEAAGKRFLILADKFCYKQIAEVIGEKFPELKNMLPAEETLKSGDFPVEGIPDVDNRRSVEVLGMTYRSLTESIVDFVKSIQALGKLQQIGISNIYRKIV